MDAAKSSEMLPKAKQALEHLPCGMAVSCSEL